MEYHSFLRFMLLTNEIILETFPSPYGVSFILTGNGGSGKPNAMGKLNFRLLTEYHSFLLAFTKKGYPAFWEKGFPSPYGVSFILTYDFFDELYNHSKKSFRLLTEYHSFLLLGNIYENPELIKFPSPYGVSFILT